ncbi:MAG: (2Fe-2S)-binding protein [Desulfobacteraceae bacterium]|uniref:(2Fe-2S)-binding protein n=1 Tax=Candidatus Desulfacyla euxinica TaxID=2841693 RepID=A0A8J6N333_9DELT|nr:(2Fe-2S)-binding protein [Candidatus Desulfacyla euxinica]MBL6979228.1 (2Fe-2S)-binding protein [Desulfobacteraceae bacterium]MBL7217854.1 (2Fe-2S)-binding protein [Desulfobacteraceae bacterium]
MLVTLTINGQIIHVERETPIFEAAKKLGIPIPTLCHHEALKPYGSCRLCTVEVVKNKWPKLVTSCNYPAEDGLEVKTDTDRVKRTRKMVMELLLARCPHVPAIQQLAQKMGVKTSQFKKKGDEQCILCGLCVRVCDEIVGVRAIGFVGRGTEREMNTPFGIESDTCIGCGACTYICPTSYIEMVERPDAPGGRSLNKGELTLDSCPNSYVCENCDREQQFLLETMQVIEKFRRENEKRRSEQKV